jgi:protein gp37
MEPLLSAVDDMNLNSIDWVIVGGESGPGARPIQKQWVRGIRKQCREAKVPFFFKQWGGTNKKKAGRKLDNRIYDEMPKLIAAYA